MDTVVSPRYLAWLWLLPGSVAGVLAALVMVVLPPDRTLHSLGDVALKISPLFLAVVAVAFVPRRAKAGPALLVAGVLLYMGAVDSLFFLHVAGWLQSALAGHGQAGFAAYYRFSLFVNAFVVLFALLAYRLGGGSTVRVLKLGLCAMLVVVSGLNDLTMWLLYPWPHGQRPETFTWASHVAVFIGRSPRLADMLVFLAIHLSLVAILLSLPAQRWLDALRVRRPRGSALPGQREEAA